MKGRVTGLLVFVLLSFQAFSQPKRVENPTKGIVPNVLVVKVKNSPLNLRRADVASPLQAVGQSLNTKSITPVLPSSHRSRFANTKSGLERIYTIELAENEGVFEAIEKLKNVDGIEYAEPLYENQPLYVTNDPYANPNSGSQYHLNNIKAYDAWNIEKGDTSVVVSIVDTGVEMVHSDLFSNLFINHHDPVNGVDDDQDGYIDNYAGWDMADNDNDPNSDTNGHGNIVAGVSSAKTNNGLGISGVGFNARFLPVKVMENTSGKLRNEYSGVIYAANQGVKVINLSWGSPWGYSKFAQDVINYAVLDKDVVVVAAAGNTPEHIDFYPASFDNVLSVTASDADDNFANWATYSHKVDIMAPGQAIFSTKSGGGYGSGGNGTSYSAPMAAGAAALVRSKYPHWDAIQVMEQLRVTADDVSEVGTNSAFKGKIGKGRLNVYRALTDTLLPSVRLQDFSYVSSFNQYVFPADTIRIYPTFINYLKETNNLKIRISSADTNTLYGEKNYLISSLNTYESKGVGDDYWEVVLSDHLLPNTRVHFRIDYESGDYTDYEYFYIDTNPTYFDIENNGLSLTISSDGDLGYDRDSFNWGNGVWINFEKISNYMGLVISRDKNYVADNVVNNYSILTKDKDFKAIEYARMYKNSIADVDARSKFGEGDHLNQLGIEVEQKILGWNDHPENNFFVLEYRVINTSAAALDSLNVAFYADYDLKEKNKNAVAYDPLSGLTYSYNKLGSQIFGGLSLLTSGDSTVYALDLADLNGNIADFSAKFPDTLKYRFSTSSMEKLAAGVNGDGNDVANLVGLKNISLQPGEARKVAFVLLAGPSVQNLNEQLERAKTKYNQYLESPPVDYIVHSCKGGSADLYPKEGSSFEVFSDAGLVNQLDSGTVYHISPINEDTSYYVVEVKDGLRKDARRATVILRESVADFVTQSDTFLISGESLDTIRFHNTSANANQFSWDFGNGYFSSVEEPVVQYKIPGNYEVKLIAGNQLGCSDTVSKPLFVAMRSVRPALEDLLVCKGERAHISASNTSTIRVYSDEGITNLVYEGNEFISDPLWNNTQFYVTNIEGYESLPVEANVLVSHPEVDFSYSVVVEENNQLLKLESNTSFAQTLLWQVNDEVHSGDHTIFYNYANDAEVDVSLSASDSVFCTDSKTQVLVPTASPVPVLEDVETCVNGHVTIVPSGGNNFLFYADLQKDNYLGSGKQLVFGPVNKDTVLYVSNVDSLIESDLAPVNIRISAFQARATVRPDTINLSETSEVEISNTSIGAESSYFVWSTGSIDTTKNVRQTIEEPGTYTYTVVATHGMGCVDTVSVTLFAYVVAAADDGQGSLENVRIYPNPATNYLVVKPGTESLYHTLEITDSQGVTVASRQNLVNREASLEIDISHLSNGIYLVRLHGENTFQVVKLAVNR